jgi:hypothetical protein
MTLCGVWKGKQVLTSQLLLPTYFSTHCCSAERRKTMGAISAKYVLALINAIHIAKIADERMNQF